MAKRHSALLCLILVFCICLSDSLCLTLAARDNENINAQTDDFILPFYRSKDRNKDKRDSLKKLRMKQAPGQKPAKVEKIPELWETVCLQVILYGDHAVYRGAFIDLTNPKMDIMKGGITDLKSAHVFKDGKQRPQAYSLMAKQDEIKRFWNNPHVSQSEAWIFIDKARYDHVSRMLRSDDPVFFRQRYMSVNGVGVDADLEKKLIHIRSNVVVTFYMTKEMMQMARNSSDRNKKTNSAKDKTIK